MVLWRGPERGVGSDETDCRKQCAAWTRSPHLIEEANVFQKRVKLMNTANLQLEGLYVVVATLLDAMCEKEFSSARKSRAY
jgi:hypothetical protein